MTASRFISARRSFLSAASSLTVSAMMSMAPAIAAAARYLAKAGNSPEAVYARGALAVRTGDCATARRYLGEAKKLGVVQAATTLAELDYRNK